MLPPLTMCHVSALKYANYECQSFRLQVNSPTSRFAYT